MSFSQTMIQLDNELSQKSLNRLVGMQFGSNISIVTFLPHDHIWKITGQDECTSLK